MNSESLEATIDRLVRMQTDPGTMMKEIRKIHPKASKKQIIRAAFALMIENADQDINASRALHHFGISSGPSSAD